MAVGHHIAGTYLSSDLRLNSSLQLSNPFEPRVGNPQVIACLQFDTDQGCRIEVNEFMILKRRL